MNSTGTKTCALRDQTYPWFNWVTAAVLLLLVCNGCSGKPKTVTLENSLESGVSGTTGQPHDWRFSSFSPAEFDLKWEAWVADPGVAWVDYDPTQIVVGFKRGAKMPSSVLVEQSTELTPAADMPNAIMRHDRRYEQLADAISAFSNLPIKHQIYNDYSLWASFQLEDVTNHREQASAIALQFADQIEYATFSGLGSPGWAPNDPDYYSDLRWVDFPRRPGEQWGQRICNFESAWEATRGDPSVLIGHIDDAFLLTHEELENTYIDPEVAYPGLELDIADNDNNVTPDNMDAPHGTWVGGLLAAEGNNERTIIGAAPDCMVVPFKIAKSPSYLQSNLDFAAALNLAIDLGVKVVNASWGSLSVSEPQRDACTRAYNNGVLVVASAMNDGHVGNNTYYPAAYDYVFCVGGTGNWDGLPENEENWLPDTRCYFSCFGSHIDIAAAGVYLKTSFYDHDNRDDLNLYEESWNGTSASCPLVAGAAALLWSARPTLSVDEVVEAMVNTAKPTKEFLGAVVRRLDAGAAMAYVLSDPNVAGIVVDHLGNPVEGVTFELSGFGSTESGAAGDFEFEYVPPNETYTLTPSLTNYTFSPSQMELELGETDIVGLEFTGTLASLPVIETLSIADDSVRGVVVGDNGLPVFVNWQANGENAVRVVYNIDFAPLGDFGLDDIEIEVTDAAGGFPFSLDNIGLLNQQIGVTATPYLAGDIQGAEISSNFWLFNHLGDTDSSGVVDDADFDNYVFTLGLSAGEPGYSVFLDSDLDGVITEADVAAVGYFFGPIS